VLVADFGASVTGVDFGVQDAKTRINVAAANRLFIFFLII
jgi:hypothetical protein